jgi:hypothetical protein
MQRRRSPWGERVRGLLIGTVGLLSSPAVVHGQSEIWSTQFGTPSQDNLYTLTSDGFGGVYVVGATAGALAGPSEGSFDAFVVRSDERGRRLWARQFGSTESDLALAATPDLAGGVFVCGLTVGDLGGAQTGNGDAWIAHLTRSGRLSWIRQLGTQEHDYANAMAPDGAGGFLVGGATLGDLAGTNTGHTDSWVARYDAEGRALWARQFGEHRYDYLGGMAPDANGGVYLGTTASNSAFIFGDQFDAWLSHMDATGTLQWTHPVGTAGPDFVGALAPDGSGGVIVGGQVVLPIPTGSTSDVWLERRDAAGTQLWLTEFGTTQHEQIFTASPDGVGGVLVGGVTNGPFGGTPFGSADGWFARCSAQGSVEWISLVGTVTYDEIRGVALGPGPSMFVAGGTSGDLAGPHIGSWDLWLARYGF